LLKVKRTSKSLTSPTRFTRLNININVWKLYMIILERAF
jgi:hypothetical protein